MKPASLFRGVAVAEAVTWALLLTGMALKSVVEPGFGVQVFGMVHGVVFIGYCLVTVLVAVDQRWSFGGWPPVLACAGAAVRDGPPSSGTPSGGAAGDSGGPGAPQGRARWSRSWPRCAPPRAGRGRRSGRRRRPAPGCHFWSVHPRAESPAASAWWPAPSGLTGRPAAGAHGDVPEVDAALVGAQGVGGRPGEDPGDPSGRAARRR